MRRVHDVLQNIRRTACEVPKKTQKTSTMTRVAWCTNHAGLSYNRAVWCWPPVIHAQQPGTVVLLFLWRQEVTCRRTQTERQRHLLLLQLIYSFLFTLLLNYSVKKNLRVIELYGEQRTMADRVKKTSQAVEKGLCYVNKLEQIKKASDCCLTRPGSKKRGEKKRASVLRLQERRRGKHNICGCWYCVTCYEYVWTFHLELPSVGSCSRCLTKLIISVGQ